MEPTQAFQIPNNSVSETYLYKQLDEHDWAADPEFQSGLHSILSSNPNPEQTEHLVLRARCFYFARKHGVSIDFAGYKRWRDQKGDTAPRTDGVSGSVDARDSTLQHASANTSEDPAAPYPVTFSQIVELISSGQPVPGIIDVPDTVLEGQASQQVATKRRKPWEMAVGHEETGIS